MALVGKSLQEPPPERLCFQNLRDFLDRQRHQGLALRMQELVKHALEVAEVEGPEV